MEIKIRCGIENLVQRVVLLSRVRHHLIWCSLHQKFSAKSQCEKLRWSSKTQQLYQVKRYHYRRTNQELLVASLGPGLVLTGETYQAYS